MFTIDASREPVPEAVKTYKSFSVMKTCFNLPVTWVNNSKNSGPRWFIIGSDIASTISEGTGIGPGVLRFCLGISTFPPSSNTHSPHQ